MERQTAAVQQLGHFSRAQSSALHQRLERVEPEIVRPLGECRRCEVRALGLGKHLVKPDVRVGIGSGRKVGFVQHEDRVRSDAGERLPDRTKRFGNALGLALTPLLGHLLESLRNVSLQLVVSCEERVGSCRKFSCVVDLGQFLAGLRGGSAHLYGFAGRCQVIDIAVRYIRPNTSLSDRRKIPAGHVRIQSRLGGDEHRSQPVQSGIPQHGSHSASFTHAGLV